MFYTISKDEFRKRVIIEFDGPYYEIFGQYLYLHSPDSLVEIQTEVEKVVTKEECFYERIDDYTSLLIEDDWVTINTHLPRDARKGEFLLDKFYQVLVDYNNAYDDVLGRTRENSEGIKKND